MALTLIGLKLAGVITWSWWWVLSPVWIGAAVVVLLAGVVAAVVLILKALAPLSRWYARRLVKVYVFPDQRDDQGFPDW